MSPTMISSINTNGRHPLNTSPRGTSGAMLFTTNALRPTGGVMAPISTIFVTSSPNSTPLNPIF